MKTPRLAVFKNRFGNYDVYLNNDLYEMDSNPLPNGLNMYNGEYEPPESNFYYVPLTDYPEGLKANINKRISEYRGKL